MTQKPVRWFSDRGFATDGSRTLPALDGGAPIFVPPPVSPPPPVGGMMVGSDLNPQGSGQLAKLEGQLGGPLGAVRLYDSGFPSNWGGSVGSGSYLGTRPLILSMKPDIPSMGTGALDAQFNNILDGAPTSHHIYWVLGHHEPDHKVAQGIYTVAEFVAAAKRMSNMIRARSVANWKCMIILTEQPWETGNPDQYWLPAYADCMGVDKYNPNNNPETNPNYRPLSYWIGKAVTWFHANSVTWGVTETGTYEDYNDLTKKSTWLKQGLDYAAQNGAQYFTYWDNAFGSDADQNARRLQSSASSLAAYAAGMAKYNS